MVHELCQHQEAEPLSVGCGRDFDFFITCFPPWHKIEYIRRFDMLTENLRFPPGCDIVISNCGELCFYGE